jgi:hypothetical protein
MARRNIPDFEASAHTVRGKWISRNMAASCSQGSAANVIKSGAPAEQGAQALRSVINDGCGRS